MSRWRLRRSCTGTAVCSLPPYGAWWTDASLSGRSEGVRWLVSSSCWRDSELSACYAAARSSSVRISRWARRSLGVASPECPRSKAAHSSNVLACPGEVWEVFIILDDPSVHVVGHGTCTPTVSMALELLLELHAFLLELESCFLEHLVPGLQLLHP